MSSARGPGAPDEDAEDSAAPADLPEEAFDLAPDEGPSMLDAALEDAAAPDPAADLGLLEAEASAQPDKGRAARLVHEVGQLHERALGSESAALKAYAKALTMDPTFRANFWPLRRIFTRRALWDNLVKLHDAELRFASLASGADRADLLTERGLLLEERMNRAGEAAAGYRAALDAAPDHPGALLALLGLACRAGDADGLETALEGLGRRARDPGRRAALAVELARARQGSAALVGAPASSGASVRAAAGAAALLREALAAGAAAGPIVDELERLAFLARDADLRGQALDARLAQHGARDPALAVALLREKARLLRPSDREAAFAALEDAHRRSPGHPLVTAELGDLAEEIGRAEAVPALLAEAATAGPALRGELAARHAEVLATAGRLGDALSALGKAGAEGLATWALRVRLLAQAGDAAGLADAYESEARRAAAGDGPAWSGIDGVDRTAWAAHTLVRAGAVRQHVLAQTTEAGGLYREALKLVPGHRAALEALEPLLARSDGWQELARLQALELAQASGERKVYLLESLVALHRDRLGDPAGAVAYQERLAAEAPEDVRARVRLADLQGLAGARDAQLESWSALASRVGDPRIEAALKLASARSIAGNHPDDERASRFLAEALTLDPAGLAGAALERALWAAGEGTLRSRLDALSIELRAAEAAGDSKRARALRYRVAFTEAEAERWADAVATLEALRGGDDAFAIAWSWELARRADDPMLEAKVLGEAGADASADRLLARAEALDAAGEMKAAAAAFEAAERAHGPTEVTIDACLGRLRLAAHAGDARSVVRETRGLADLLREGAPPAGAAAETATDVATVTARALRREADLFALAAGLPAEEQVGGADRGTAEAAVLAWTAGVRARDQEKVAAGLEAMASTLAGDDAAAIRIRAAGRARIAGAGYPAATYARALADETDGPSLAVAVGLTDLAASGAQASAPAAAARLREWRAERAGGALALELHLERGEGLEAQGRLRDAAASFQRALEVSPDSLPALEGLRRLARASGDRSAEARVLAALGDRVRTPMRAAQVLAEAALIHEEMGEADLAAPLYRKVLVHAPDDQEAYQRLHRILMAAGDLRAVDRLISDKVQRVAEGPDRVRLYSRRAAHRLERLGDRRGGVQDLRRILKIDPDHAETLQKLARIAGETGRHEKAAELLDRYLAVHPAAETDADLLIEARLALAAACEGLGDRKRAIAALEAAVESRPDDPVVLERLTELKTKERDWAGALETLAAWEACPGDDRARASVARRIGRILRDHRSETGPGPAAAAFQRAVELDPSGEGVAELAALHEAAGNTRARDQVLERAVADARDAAVAEPLDSVRVDRLREILVLAGRHDDAAPVAQCLALLAGQAPPPSRGRELRRPISPESHRARLADPATRGLLSEVWPLLGEALARIDAVDPAGAGATRQTRAAPGSDARLLWVEAAARCLGFPKLTLFVGGHLDHAATPLALPEPALVLGRAMLAGDAVARFRVGRAIGLLREQATRLEVHPPADLAILFAAAALIAGAAPPAEVPRDAAEARARILGKVLGRKERKALLLQVGRFAAEGVDAGAWRSGVLRTADRVGLLVSADVAAAVRASANLPSGAGASDIRGRLDQEGLVAFALGEDYVALRRETGLIE